MKSLQQVINEKLKLADVKFYKPTTKGELKELLKQLIEERGYDGDFNDIDTSEIIDMRDLIPPRFNGDISKWNVSKVEDMESMFEDCTEFNGNLSKWDVSKVKNMNAMFNWCKSFTGKGLEKWDVSNVKDMQWTFYKCYALNCDLSNWKINKHCNLINTFYDCNITPDWWDDDWMQI